MTEYYVNGKKVKRGQFLKGAKKKFWEQGPAMATDTYSEHDPLINEGMGCMKAQVPEVRELIRKHSIQGAQVTDDGKIRFTSRRARKELLNRRGLVDLDGGYGD